MIEERQMFEMMLRQNISCIALYHNHVDSALKDFLKAANVNYIVNPATGIISVMDSHNRVLWKGVPSYTFGRSTRRSSGIAIDNAGDLNNDGLPDLWITSKKGRQAIYTHR